MESDDKIKSGLWVPGSPLVIPSFFSFHKTSSYIQGRISLEYVKWGVWATRRWGKAYWYPGVITPPLPAGERGRHRRLPEASACYVGRNGQQHPWDTVWGKKKKKGQQKASQQVCAPFGSETDPNNLDALSATRLPRHCHVIINAQCHIFTHTGAPSVKLWWCTIRRQKETQS